MNEPPGPDFTFWGKNSTQSLCSVQVQQVFLKHLLLKTLRDHGRLTHSKAIVRESSTALVLLVQLLFAADGVLHKVDGL